MMISKSEKKIGEKNDIRGIGGRTPSGSGLTEENAQHNAWWRGIVGLGL